MTEINNKFVELQYLTLRKEIEDAKGRAFKVLAGEIFAIPAAQILIGLIKYSSEDNGLSNALEVVIITMPIFVFSLVLRFIYENNSITRCGKYIKKFVEPHYVSNDINYIGWETWLEGSYAFNWNKAIDNESSRLRRILSKKFDIRWGEFGEASREDRCTIKIPNKVNENDFILLRIGDKKKTALDEFAGGIFWPNLLQVNRNPQEYEVILGFKGKINKDFVAKMDNGDLNIYEDTDKRLAEMILKDSFYVLSVVYYIVSVILGLMSAYTLLIPKLSLNCLLHLDFLDSPNFVINILVFIFVIFIYVYVFKCLFHALRKLVSISTK